jgi:membrane-associated phospholipid phosphatase
LIQLKKGRCLEWALAFFLLAASSPLFAEEPFVSADPDVTLAHFPDKILSDLPHALEGSNPWILLSGGTLAAADGFLLDPHNPWPAPLQSWGTPELWNFGNFYGEGWVEGFGSVGCWAWGGFSGDPRLAQFGRDASESLLMATVLVTGLKYAFPRERPDGSNDLSFPSGHTITAFSVAPVIARYGGDELGIPAYVLAAITGLARVEGDHHYLSDVLVGATLGVVLGNMVVDETKNPSISLGPARVSATLVFN